mmetsp:Transcript_28458/g.61872  ORF Transcript_28458/g.61872 Transcript_28458/m.61872 type:complete len:397 (+) Transcript_28458:1140-2330(+)
MHQDLVSFQRGQEQPITARQDENELGDAAHIVPEAPLLLDDVLEVSRAGDGFWPGVGLSDVDQVVDSQDLEACWEQARSHLVDRLALQNRLRHSWGPLFLEVRFGISNLDFDLLLCLHLLLQLSLLLLLSSHLTADLKKVVAHVLEPLEELLLAGLQVDTLAVAQLLRFAFDDVFYRPSFKGVTKQTFQSVLLLEHKDLWVEVAACCQVAATLSGELRHSLQNVRALVAKGPFQDHLRVDLIAVTVHRNVPIVGSLFCGIVVFDLRPFHPVLVALLLLLGGVGESLAGGLDLVADLARSDEEDGLISTEEPHAARALHEAVLTHARSEGESSDGAWGQPEVRSARPRFVEKGETFGGLDGRSVQGQLSLVVVQDNPIFLGGVEENHPLECGLGQLW